MGVVINLILIFPVVVIRRGFIDLDQLASHRYRSRVVYTVEYFSLYKFGLALQSFGTNLSVITSHFRRMMCISIPQTSPGMIEGTASSTMLRNIEHRCRLFEAKRPFLLGAAVGDGFPAA